MFPSMMHQHNHMNQANDAKHILKYDVLCSCRHSNVLFTPYCKTGITIIKLHSADTDRLTLMSLWCRAVAEQGEYSDICER